MTKTFYKNLILEIPASVYEPREDSFLLAEVLEKENLAGKKVLDLGTGSGLLAILAARGGAEVFAADIDEKTLECAKQNAKANGAKINFVLSDLFQNLKKEKFDFIIFNAPYLPEKQTEFSRAWAAGENSELILRFISEAKNFLNPAGKILLLISSLAGIEKTRKKFGREGFSASIIKEKKIPWETLFAVEARKLDL